ncbi:hypothetical protein COOONC_19263 [Cooperia oncophora]
MHHSFFNTTSALLSTISLWFKEVDECNYVIVRYLDSSTRFHLSSPSLYNKTIKGFDGCLLNFLKSFPTGRLQLMGINDVSSRTYLTTSGVSYGSLMLLLFTDDLPRCLSEAVSCSLFANDSKISVLNNCKLLQNALDAVNEWSIKWKVEILPEKIFAVKKEKRKRDRFQKKDPRVNLNPDDYIVTLESLILIPSTTAHTSMHQCSRPEEGLILSSKLSKFATLPYSSSYSRLM